MADRKFWSMMYRLATEEKFSSEEGEAKGGVGGSFVKFIKEVGDQEVPNPNRDGRKKKIKIKSLPSDAQRDIYRKWLKSQKKKDPKNQKLQKTQLSIKKPSKPKLESAEGAQFLKDVNKKIEERAKKWDPDADVSDEVRSYATEDVGEFDLDDLPKEEQKAMRSYLEGMGQFYAKKHLKETGGKEQTHAEKRDNEGLRRRTKEKDKQRKKASPLLHGLIRLAHTNPEHRADLLPIIAGELRKEARSSKRMRRLRRRKRRKKIPVHKAVGLAQEKWKELDVNAQIKVVERAYERLSKRKSLNRKQKRIQTTLRFWYNSKGRKFRAKRRKFFDRLKRTKSRLKR